MRKNKIKFKKPFAAASAFAIVVATSGNVLGNAWEDMWTTTTSGQNSDRAIIEQGRNGKNVVKVGVGWLYRNTTVAPFTNESNFYFNWAYLYYYPTQLAIKGNTKVGAIDLYGQGQKIIIDGDVSIGSVVSYNYPSQKAELTINESQKLTLGAENKGKDSNNKLVNIGFYANLGNITIGKGASLVVDFDTTLSEKIDSDDNKAGILDIKKNVTFKKDVGGVQQLQKIEVENGAEATFEKAVEAEGLIVEGTMIAKGTVSGDIELKQESATVALYKDLEGNITVTGAINGEDNNYGILEFIGEGSKVEGAVGKDTKLLNEVKFTGDGTITDNVYAKNINVQESKKATLGGTVLRTENGLNLLGKTSTVSFSSNTTVDSQIKGNGIVEFQSGATLNKNIGDQDNRVNEVKFLAVSDIGLKSNIYSNKIDLQGKIDVKQNVQMFGQIDANKATISLGQNTLDIDNNIKFKGENTINATIEDNKIGNIKANSVTYEDDSKLKINISCMDRPTGGKSRTYVFLDTESSTLDNNKIEVSAAEGSCSKLTLDSSNTQGITLIVKHYT